MIRSILLAGAAAIASLGAAQAQDRLDPGDPQDTLKIMRKIQCSLKENEPAIYWWHGVAYSRKQGERDRKLFNVEGMNIRACSRTRDRELGQGFALVSREILLYKDPETNEVLTTWDNPWTGETVEVLHVANDPVNFEMYETGRGGQPTSWAGEIGPDGTWWYRSTFPLWYPNPLGGAFQQEVGGTYHATELFNFFGRTDDLLDPDLPSAKVTVGWSRIADWLPWMKMNGREGIIYMHTAGRKLSSFDELSDTMKEQIATHYPDYARPPRRGDDRENMTSWEYYKRVKEGSIEPPRRGGD
ncbi:DUF1838 family protein [Parvularcula lutaonensis]|uniref:DUF1838 family protein n=1 Tax=Parvularcula lutaonensis TaxID=491923 RepID=A0ABV7MAT0_9PROT|nr:DUF1838 family protein [Parvularcula lutaonensis]GGY38499.1 hypothetical protein GCM10007148_03510 [Parvularcula lutaonensis]